VVSAFFFFVLTLTPTVQVIAAEPFAETWRRTYGGTDTEDYAYSMVQTGDGGFAIAGTTRLYSTATRSAQLIKTDANGNQQLRVTYSKSECDQEAYSVVQTSDGGYVIAGKIDPDSWAYGDVWLAKTDANGNIQWSKNYGGIGLDVAQSVVQTSDGGYVLAGYTVEYDDSNYIIVGGDFWLVKTDANGNALWNRTYGGNNNDRAQALVETDDGGYAITGYTSSFGAGEFDFWLVKADSAGNEQWNKTYGGTSGDVARALVETVDGGYALTGYTRSFGAGGRDFWLVKTDANGNALWNRTYGGAGSDEAYSVVQTSDGGYAITGYTNSGAGRTDVWLVKTDANGNALWNRIYGWVGFDGAYSVVQTSDGGYTIAGYKSDGGEYTIAGYTYYYGAGNSDFWLVKTDPNGNVAIGLWEQWGLLIVRVLIAGVFSASAIAIGGRIMRRRKLLRRQARFNDSVNRQGMIQIGTLSKELKLDDDSTGLLLKKAIEDGTLNGYFTEDGKAFITKQYLKKTLDDKLG